MKIIFHVKRGMASVKQQLKYQYTLLLIANERG